MQYLIIILVTFLASMIGAVCGIGGGVVIKPVLDALGIMSVNTVSFLSGCTVLCMTCYSVGMNLKTKSIPIRMRISVPVSIGAAVGGVIGKSCFQSIRMMFENKETVGKVQAACLLALTFGTLLYTVNKKKIKTNRIERTEAILLIGLVLGMFSSFLGIGGGPFNLVFLSFFFSMETKEAAQTSLFIILFSQITSLCSTIIKHQVPEVQWMMLISMAGLGILGAVGGRALNKRISAKVVDKLFIGITIIIIGICFYNIVR